MAVSARFASANSGTANNTSVAASWATPAAAGDRMYAAVSTISASANPSTPTGWSVEKTFAGYSTFFGFAIFTKVATGGETSVASTLALSGRWAIGVAILSGADAPGASGARAETSRVSPVPATTNSLVFPQLTPAYDLAYLLEMSAVRYESSASPGSVAVSDTNWTRQVNTCTTNTTGAQIGIMMAVRQRASGTTSVQTTPSTAATSPNSLNSNGLISFPATTVADPTVVPPGWDEYRIFKR